MKELSLVQILSNSFSALLNSKVFVLFILELAILILFYSYSKIMNKKVVKRVSMITGLIVLLFYVLDYIDTLRIFVNNVSKQIIELMYFPTTLEFTIVMIISFVIMAITLVNKKSSKILKIINSFIPLFISFLFLSIIEYINSNSIPFNEYSIFTDPTLMSLNELAMGVFVAWIISLVIYFIDNMIIRNMNAKEIINDNYVPSVQEITIPKSKIKVKVNEPLIVDPEENNEHEEIELPKLKSKSY